MISGGSHPLDEREIEQLKLRLTEAEADRQSLQRRLDDYKETCKQLNEMLDELRPAAAAEDWHREYGQVLIKAFRERDEAKSGLLRNVELAALKARNARLEELFQQRVENRRWMVGELRRHNSRRGKLMEFLDLHENSEDISRWAQTEIRSIFAVDAELADINRRVEADKRVLEAAEALYAAAELAEEEADWDDEPFATLMLALCASVRARRALVEVEDTPTPQDRDEATGGSPEEPGVDGVKPDPDRAFRDHNGRIWVLWGGKLHLSGWLHGIEPTDMDNMVELTVPVEATPGPCGSCEGSRWVDDENWQPEDWEWARGRIPASGRIPCGICNEGGWSIPDIKPGVEATGEQKHECSEVDNGFGGYLCTCGGLWPVSFGGCSDLPKEQRAANKAAWDEGQRRRAEMLAKQKGGA